MPAAFVGMTIAWIAWGLLLLAYGASTVPLFRQGFRRVPTPRHPVVGRGARVLHQPAPSRVRRASRPAA